jgi:CRP/FNR family transcriptional regulator
MIKKLLTTHFPSLANHRELIDMLAEKCQIHSFKKGEVILRNGQYIQVIPLLISGLVKVYREGEEEGEVLLYYIKSGESCAMSMTALIKNETVKVKGVVEEDAEILLVPAIDAVSIAQNYPVWNAFIYDLFSNKYDELLTVISTLTFSNKDVRLYKYLKQQAELKDSNVLAKTHQEIALDLGSSREVISRLLKKLENDKKIRLAHSKIELL